MRCFFEIKQILGLSDSTLIPRADYTFKSHRNPHFVYVYKNMSYSYKFNILNYYNLLIGQHYQIRVCYKLKSYSGTSDVFSNWIDIIY